MSVSERFMSIIPLHQKILDRLIAQRRVDPLGAIGWRGPLEDLHTTLPTEMIYEPLLARGLVEDCAEAMQHASGKFLVRITDLGVKCAAFGMMMKIPCTASSYDLLAIEHVIREKKDSILEATNEA